MDIGELVLFCSNFVKISNLEVYKNHSDVKEIKGGNVKRKLKGLVLKNQKIKARLFFTITSLTCVYS